MMAPLQHTLNLNSFPDVLFLAAWPLSTFVLVQYAHSINTYPILSALVSLPQTTYCFFLLRRLRSLARSTHSALGASYSAESEKAAEQRRREPSHWTTNPKTTISLQALVGIALVFALLKAGAEVLSVYKPEWWNHHVYYKCRQVDGQPQCVKVDPIVRQGWWARQDEALRFPGL